MAVSSPEGAQLRAAREGSYRIGPANALIRVALEFRKYAGGHFRNKITGYS